MDHEREAAEAEPPSTEPPSLQSAATTGLLARPLFPATAKERERIAPFPQSERSRLFRRRFFPDASAMDWNDWRWQLRHRIRDLAGLARVIRLSEDERSAVAQHEGPLPVGITPYYASLLSETDPGQPLRRTHIPVNGEYLRTPGESDDPLGEDHDAAVPGLVHRYPDRVLFLTTGFCSTYCRYCTRSRMVGGGGEYTFSLTQWQRAIDYIADNPQMPDRLLRCLRDASRMDSAALIVNGPDRPGVEAAVGPLGEALVELTPSEIHSLSSLVNDIRSCYTGGDALGRGFVGTDSLRDAGARVVMVLPLWAQRTRLGSVVLAHSRPLQLTGEEVRPLETLTDHVASALASRRRVALPEPSVRWERRAPRRGGQLPTRWERRSVTPGSPPPPDPPSPGPSGGSPPPD